MILSILGLFLAILALIYAIKISKEEHERTKEANRQVRVELDKIKKYKEN